MIWAFTYLNLCCCNYNNSSSILVVHTIGQSGVVHIIIADNQPFGSLMRVQRVSCHICEWTAIISVNWCEKGHVSCPITTQFAWTMPGLLMWLLLRKHVARTLLAKQFHEEKISSDISYLVYYMYYLDNSFDSWLQRNFLPTHQFWIFHFTQMMSLVTANYNVLFLKCHQNRTRQQEVKKLFQQILLL